MVEFSFYPYKCIDYTTWIISKVKQKPSIKNTMKYIITLFTYKLPKNVRL